MHKLYDPVIPYLRIGSKKIIQNKEKCMALIHGTKAVAAIWRPYNAFLWNSPPRTPFPAQLPADLRMTPISRMEPCSCYTRGVCP